MVKLFSKNWRILKSILISVGPQITSIKTSIINCSSPIYLRSELRRRCFTFLFNGINFWWLGYKFHPLALNYTIWQLFKGATWASIIRNLATKWSCILWPSRWLIAWKFGNLLHSFIGFFLYSSVILDFHLFTYFSKKIIKFVNRWRYWIQTCVHCLQLLPFRIFSDIIWCSIIASRWFIYRSCFIFLFCAKISVAA